MLLGHPGIPVGVAEGVFLLIETLVRVGLLSSAVGLPLDVDHALDLVLATGAEEPHHDGRFGGVDLPVAGLEDDLRVRVDVHLPHDTVELLLSELVAGRDVDRRTRAHCLRVDPSARGETRPRRDGGLL